MKSVTVAVTFLVFGLCLGHFTRMPTVHAQTSRQSQLGVDTQTIPRAELIEEVKPGDWIPNFKGTMRAVSLSCVPGDHGERCYVLLQSN
jgi:hypothetical protein